MIVLGLVFLFVVLGIGFAVVAYSANNRKRAGQNPIATNYGQPPRHSRATGDGH